MTSQTSYCRCEQSCGICHLNEQQGSERLGVKKGGGGSAGHLLPNLSHQQASGWHFVELPSRTVPLTADPYYWRKPQPYYRGWEAAVCVCVFNCVWENEGGCKCKGSQGKGQPWESRREHSRRGNKQPLRFSLASLEVSEGSAFLTDDNSEPFSGLLL